MSILWKCAGCGSPSEARERTCDCPTNVLVNDQHHSIWKESEEECRLRSAAEAWAKILAGMQRFGMESTDIDTVNDYFRVALSEGHGEASPDRGRDE